MKLWIKNIFKMLLIIGIIIAILTVFIKYNLDSKKAKAAKLAKNYISGKYTAEMDFKHVNYSWIDPSLYHVFFVTKNQPKITFRVLVQDDLCINEEDTNEYGKHYSPDNYLLKYFEFYSEDILNTNALEIWGENVIVHVISENTALYSFEVPIEINETMTPIEMEEYIDYDIFVHSGLFLEKENKEIEAQRILEMINVIKESKNTPKEILFWYKVNTDKNKDKNIEDGEEYYLTFENWKETSSVSDVLEQMKIQRGL